MPEIAQRQNAHSFTKLLAAQKRAYDKSQSWHRLNVLGSICFAGAGVVATFWFNDAALYVAAFAGLWIFLGGTFCRYQERGGFSKGARIQEQFDCELFELDWNAALVGDRVPPEEIFSLARNRPTAKLAGWYPSNVDSVDSPLNVVLCQRTNVCWGLRAHEEYFKVLLGALGIWVCTILAIGSIENLSLNNFLLWLLFPSLPAMLEAVELISIHRESAQAKRRVLREADAALASQAASNQTCRSLQDGVFESRRRPPKVPNWYYNLRRESNELSAVEAVDAIKSQHGL